MKKLMNISLLAIFLLGSAVFAQQPPKFGHINTNELLQIMPGRDSASVELGNYAKELEATFVAMQNEFQTKFAEYQERQATLSDLIRQARERELMSLQDRIQEFQEGAQQDMADQESKLLGPIIQKARDAIGEVAKEHGYTYIFDAGMGFLLYSEPSDDIMPLVKKKLGL